MSATAEAFYNVSPRKGLSIGVVPSESHGGHGFATKPGYPNQWVEITIRSPLGVYSGNPQEMSRNHINILTSDVIVALPGNRGTKNEVSLAIAFMKPAILLGPADCFSDFPTDLPRAHDAATACEFIERHASWPVADTAQKS